MYVFVYQNTTIWTCQFFASLIYSTVKTKLKNQKNTQKIHHPDALVFIHDVIQVFMRHVLKAVFNLFDHYEYIV